MTFQTGSKIAENVKKLIWCSVSLKSWSAILQSSGIFRTWAKNQIHVSTEHPRRTNLSVPYLGLSTYKPTPKEGGDIVDIAISNTQTTMSSHSEITSHEIRSLHYSGASF